MVEREITIHSLPHIAYFWAPLIINWVLDVVILKNSAGITTTSKKYITSEFHDLLKENAENDVSAVLIIS